MGTATAALDKQNGKVTLSPRDDQRYVSLGDAEVFFDGRIYEPHSGTLDIETIAKKFQHIDRLEASEAFIGEVEGDFTFIIAEPERIIAGRDPVGVQPLYYGENQSVAAFGSNRKGLWDLGVDEVRSFPPGHVGFVGREGFKFEPVKTLKYSEPKRVNMQEAAETLQELLGQAVRSRVSGIEDVVVAFSGGLDSSVVAFLAKQCPVNVHLFHVSLNNQPETEEAKKVADALGMSLKVHLFRKDDVERVVPKVVEVIEEADPVKASIGVPFYWAAQKTAEFGFKVMLVGQGADELFGGYQRYVNEYLLRGEEAARKTMFDDVVGIHESNLERDVKICSFHDVELRMPFASYKIAEYALSLPVELKIEKRANTLRKLVLRKAAENMGLPKSVTEKTKKAVQYSTGINSALKKIAKKQKTTLAEYVKQLFFSQTNKN